MDLFGDIDDISSESDDQLPSPGQPTDEHGVPQEQSEEDPSSEVRLEVEIPSISSDLGSEFHFVKLPKFLSIEPRPFDPQYYEDELENEEVLNEEDSARLKLKIENTIRWRIRRDEEGNKIKESNTRIVKWSDGSMSLHLGSEVFDVYKVPLLGNYSHLFIREDTGLQGQAIFTSKLTFRPHSTDSATHRNMTLPLARRSKSQKITLLPMAVCDPECQRPETIKQEKRRASTHRDPQAAQERGKQSLRRPDVSYLDSGSDEEEQQGQGALSLADTKSHYPGGLQEGEPSRKRKAEDEVEDDD